MRAISTIESRRSYLARPTISPTAQLGFGVGKHEIGVEGGSGDLASCGRGQHLGAGVGDVAGGSDTLGQCGAELVGGDMRTNNKR